VSGPIGADDHFLQDFRNPFHLNLDALFLGAICAWLADSRKRAPGLTSATGAGRARLAGIALIIALMAAPWAVGSQPFFYQVMLFPLTALGMAMILFAAALLPIGSARMLENRWLARAGRIAYPWYLTHVLVLHWLGGELPGLVGNAAMTPAARFGIFLPIFVVASVAVALALHFAIEKPCLILKDRVGARPARIASSIPADAST
jgi:peptidoglycan/LPS O-acetylase OafA/YrhL